MDGQTSQLDAPGAAVFNGCHFPIQLQPSQVETCETVTKHYLFNVLNIFFVSAHRHEEI